MAMTKSPPALVERFAVVMDRFPDAGRRKMFGYQAAFIGGNMVTGLHEARWVVRLPEGELAELQAAGGMTFEPMAGRPMKSFAVLPAEIVGDDQAIASWIERAIAHGRTLPAKK